ncbi:hypothetical protein PHMEG_00026042 [Phytophthora megakarya]|uniref:Uncharacterized protein n=1 Tax=Phytophthora megakarya TaxID=4795 RepID=A0A225VC99_9STRA|nr:hypothetical protein PHMEG_00026042 [Phytophthora megakarya]
MNFHSIWPLLLKEKWTATPSKGLDIRTYDYVKPGCKRSRGTRGVDYFNGEDELLVYVRSDKDLCSRHGISNVVVRWKDPIGAGSEYSASDNASNTDDAVHDGNGIPDTTTEQLLRHTETLQGCGDMDKLDPNLVTGELDTFLESDGEGQEDSGENADDSDSDCDDGPDEDGPDCTELRSELTRVTLLMSEEELGRLHMSIQGK